jgi:hypothetical protein
MAPSTGIQLAQGIRKRIEELKKLCEGVDESAASCAPAGRWSPKEILSHLLEPEETGHLSMLQAFLDRETPLIYIEPENPFFTGKRARMTFDQLLAEVERQHGRIAKFAAVLSGKQLGRKAHIPMLKESPFGEYPTLETWIGLLGGSDESHVKFHINHMREILQGVAAQAK